MIPAHALLGGTVTRSDTHQGVHGLRVEAWDADHPSDRPLAVATTGRDGAWQIDLRGPHCHQDHRRHDDHRGHHGKPDCCECPKVYIKLRDRDCRLIHDGCADRRCCEHGRPVRIDVSLAPQALWWHLSRPLSWERIDEPLVPVRVMQEIEDAIELLQANGMAPGASLALATCATPPIEGFDRLLRDAWDTLQGDLDAARRYREVLEALCGSGSTCHGESPFACEVGKLFDGACCEQPDCDCKEQAPQPVLFKAMLRDTAPGALLRIVKDNKVVWERRGAAQPPVIREAHARLGEDQQLELSWRIEHDGQHEDPHAQNDVWVRWSSDEGKTWHALTVGLHGNAASVDVSQLPAGPVRFELLANDGFYTARATTGPVVLPEKAPSVAILYPADGQQVYPDRLIHLAGSAASHSGAPIDPSSAAWFIDDEPVGTGLDLWVGNPGAGRHTVRLEASADGLTGSASSAIEVLAD